MGHKLASSAVLMFKLNAKCPTAGLGVITNVDHSLVWGEEESK